MTLRSYDINDYKEPYKYSDEELYAFLKNNINVEPRFLVMVCAEVLRRILQEEFEEKNVD